MKPQVGDKINGKFIGKSRRTFIWVICPVCQKGRWIDQYYLKIINDRPWCYKCSHSKRGELNPRWKGGRFTHARGYVLNTLTSDDDFFLPMVNNSHTVLEHRLVMAKHLGRCLLPWEIVHHRNGIKDDNRIENLQLLPDRSLHVVDGKTKTLIRRLQKKVEWQETQIKLLQYRLNAFENEDLIRSDEDARRLR